MVYDCRFIEGDECTAMSNFGMTEVAFLARGDSAPSSGCY